MEIERKYLPASLPFDPADYPCHRIEQGYLCTDPVVRIRKQDEDYYLTYKGKGLMMREEYNLPLNAESYEHLKSKIDGVLLSKTRHLISLEKWGYKQYTLELDVFDAPYEGLMIAEVEFPDEKSANAFVPPAWFGKDVTFSRKYHNSVLSQT